LGGALVAVVALWGREGVLFTGLYTVDSLVLFLKMVAVVSTGLVVLSAIEFMRGRTPYRGEFYTLLLFTALAISLIAAATDLILIYLAIELLSITSYVLTGYLREDPKSNEAAIKYFLYGAAASAVMLYGMSLLYGATGSTNLSEIATALREAEASLRGVVFPAAVLLLVGFGFKIAAVPFHQWAPDAYEGAPTPVTAFLSVGPKVAGFAVLARVFLTALPSFQPDRVVALLAGISVVTMTFGNLVALTQRNIKRMLAYSSIAQAGYILLGVVAASTLGMTSLVFYLIVYSFTNLGAFIVVITFSNGGGGDAIEDYAGLSQRSPGLALAMVLFLLSLAGIPPLAGFVGKFYLFAAAMKEGFLWLVLVGVINSIVSLYYYLQVIRQMYIIPPRTEEAIPASRALSSALLIAMAGVLLLGIYPAPLIELIQVAARAFLSG